MNPTLEVSSLTKSFDGERVVDTISFAVRSGEIAVIVGPSGGGKTTVLRCIAGFERPDSGSISINGELVVDSETFIAPEYRHVGYVPQEGALFPHLSVAGNVGFGLPRSANRLDRVPECLALVGMAGFENRRVDELSGGQQQRVALARAMAPRPQLIVMDEPFSALDAALRPEICADVVAALRADEATAIIVTHDRDEALAVADRIAVMMNGSVMQYDDPVTLYKSPASDEVAEFLGDFYVERGVALDGLVTTASGTFAANADLDGNVDVVRRTPQLRVFPTPK
ncbi:MAG: ABC transporter ATP-binding protein [Acidimicrobiales bacterium]